MPLDLQVIDARNSQELKNVASNCTSSAQFLAYLNTATRQLMKRGGWVGTEATLKMCVQGCEVTMPRMVRAILGVNACGAELPTANRWFSIIRGSGCNLPVPVVEDVGMFPCYSEVSGNEGKKIAYHVVKNSDIGKTITIYGKKYGGQPLQERDADGNWRDGVTVTAISAGGATLPAMTTDLVTQVTHVKREATSGMAYLYEYDTVGQNLRNLADYQPNETSPLYRRYRINQIGAIPSYEDSNGRTLRKISLMVSLDFVPMVNDFDFLLIDDIDALKYAFQAIRKDEAGEVEEAEKFWIKAVRELNMAERMHNPSQSFVAKVRVMGSSRVISNPI